MAPHSIVADTKATPNPSSAEAPPPYTAVDDNSVPPTVDLAAHFANLAIDNHTGDKDVEVPFCLAHLKLLHAFQALKEDVGYTDGLWDIWDARAPLEIDAAIRESDMSSSEAAKMTDSDKEKFALSKMREKRWALYVARAVDRYEAWWHSFPADMLVEDDMYLRTSPKFAGFPTSGAPMKWTEMDLPPLDVLLVSHAHTLNPRSYLEDTMRYGLQALWTAGFPWKLISDAIDTSFSYSVSDDAKAAWVARTGREWVNENDSLQKSLDCPYCAKPLSIPWTTCGLSETAKTSVSPGLVGNGYGDGNLLQTCTGCQRDFTKDQLCVSKFIQDAKLCLNTNAPMPGTILQLGTGQPSYLRAAHGYHQPQLFPSRMIRRELHTKIPQLLQNEGDSMETVRDMVAAIIADPRKLAHIDGFHTVSDRYRTPKLARVHVRKCLSRYWDNFSPFALDLTGAVMRQGVFVEKMVKLDWLHSPTALDTMKRLITKYMRFLGLMLRHPGKVVVPTLDVDLGWHTHQLSPRAYYTYTVGKTLRFIDHDDKIDEAQLSEAFEWTTKIYQDTYNEIYSACSCWYCEAIRSSVTSPVGKLLKVSQSEKISESFHTSGQAQLCPPDNSAHISSHNAVRFHQSDEQQRVYGAMRARQKEKLEKEYQKARKRAEKKGRALPPRDEYYLHWGYSYYMYGPYMYPMYFAPGMYVAATPAYVGGGCAAGSCGGTVGAGACSMSAGCGSVGGACGGGSGGCAGGSGGCGGGGGGCGGGGGS